VGLPEVHILGVDDEVNGFLCIYIESRAQRPGCAHCGVLAQIKDRTAVELVDLPCFGRPTRLIWHKCRWRCPESSCPVGSWTDENERIGAPRMAISDRAGRWVTEQVGRHARSVNEIATELGCDWHTVNDTVIAYGTALVDDDPNRFGTVEALGLDEVLFARIGPWKRQEFSTQMVDVGVGHLLDVVPGRSGAEPTAWLEKQGKEWRDKVRCGHKADPLYRCRRLLTKAEERLSEAGKEKLMGLLRAGDPRGDVATMWEAKEAVRELY
jgi:transposase